MAKTVDKILYRSGKFYALRLPEEPQYGHGTVGINYLTDQWEKQVESIMTNPPEIVNPELVDVSEDEMSQCLHIKGKYLREGDIFPLPSNMRFEEEIIKHCETLCENSHCKIHGCMNPLNGDVKVVRIVKAETEYDHNKAETARLEPCPFCGGKAGHDVFFHGYESPGHFYVKCSKCQTQTRDDRPDKVVANWNHRTQPEPEESQEELWGEAQLTVKSALAVYSNDNVVDLARWAIEALQKYYTIQRKKQ